MQDPFDIAKITISELLTPEDQVLLYVTYLAISTATSLETDLLIRHDLYFSNCHHFIPILHKPSFGTKDDDLHLLLSVYALSCRHDDTLRSKAGIFYSLAKQTTQATFINPTMSTLAALLLQAVYEIGHPNTSVHSLTTVGAALSLASAFRLLHMDEEHPEKPNRWMDAPRDWIEEEGRRRTFLMVLSFARWMATIEQRELGFPVMKEIMVVLPVSDEEWFAGVRLHRLLRGDMINDS